MGGDGYPEIAKGALVHFTGRTGASTVTFYSGEPHVRDLEAKDRGILGDSAATAIQRVAEEGDVTKDMPDKARFHKDGLGTGVHDIGDILATPHPTLKFKAGVMEVVTPIAERGRNTGGLYHANQMAAFDYSERQDAFAARIMNCMMRAFDAIGASSATQEIIFWRLHETQNLGRNEIMDKPTEFIVGLKAILGEAGVVVFEYMMTREIKREFCLTAAFDKEPTEARDLADLLQLAAYAALESQGKSEVKPSNTTQPFLPRRDPFRT